MNRSQAIVDLLKDAGKAMSRDELASALNCTKQDVSGSLCTLKKSGRVESPSRGMWQLSDGKPSAATAGNGVALGASLGVATNPRDKGREEAADSANVAADIRAALRSSPVPLGRADIAELSGVDPYIVSKRLSSMKERGYVRQAEDGWELTDAGVALTDNEDSGSDADLLGDETRSEDADADDQAEPSANLPSAEHPVPVANPFNPVLPPSAEPSAERAVRDTSAALRRKATSLPTAEQDPVGLLARIDAVSADAEDLIGDALDGEVSRKAIKAMCVAVFSLNRAHRAIFESNLP